MDFSKLSNWLQVSANIGIVLGLVLVGIQLKQNADLARLQLLYDESWRVVQLELEVVGERGAEVWAKSIEEPEHLTLDEVRIMEALLWAFIENLRGTYRLSKLGLLEDEDWRRRVDAEVDFYLSDPYSRAWWRNFGGEPTSSIPEELRTTIQNVIANDDTDVIEYILQPRRSLEVRTSTK